MDLVFRLLVETLHLSLPQAKIQQQDDWTWRSAQGNKHRFDFLGVAEAVQPHVHSCAPTDAMMFGSGKENKNDDMHQAWKRQLLGTGPRRFEDLRVLFAASYGTPTFRGLRGTPLRWEKSAGLLSQ